MLRTWYSQVGEYGIHQVGEYGIHQVGEYGIHQVGEYNICWVASDPREPNQAWAPALPAAPAFGSPPLEQLH